MRRKNKEIRRKGEIESIMQTAIVCRIGLSANDVPYVVPVNFGYEDGRLYFHSAIQGKKIDIIRQNNQVCFELDIDHELLKSEAPCSWGMKYRSVIGFGKAFFINDLKEKARAANIILQHYSDSLYELTEEQMRDVTVIRVEIDAMSGKKSGY